MSWRSRLERRAAGSPQTLSRAPPNSARCVKTLARARYRTALDCLAVAWASTAELCPKTRAKSCSSHDHSIASNRRHEELRSPGRPAGSRRSHAMTPAAIFLVPLQSAHGDHAIRSLAATFAGGRAGDGHRWYSLSSNASRSAQRTMSSRQIRQRRCRQRSTPLDRPHEVVNSATKS